MASGFDSTHVCSQDQFADLSVEATLIDPKYALPSDLRELADQLADYTSEASSPAPKGRGPEPTRAKVRVNQLGSGMSTQIGEMIPADMDVLMTAHLPTSFSLEDIAGDELGDDRPEKRGEVRVEASEALVRAVDDFSDEDEPRTVSAFVEDSIPVEVVRVTRHKQPVVEKKEDTAPMRPSRQPVQRQPAYEMSDTIEPQLDPTLPPASKRAGFVSSGTFPQNEVTKTSFGAIPRAPEYTDVEEAFHADAEQKIVFRDDIDDDFGGLPAQNAFDARFDDQPFGDIGEDPVDDIPALADIPAPRSTAMQSESPSPDDRKSFDKILQRVRKPKVEIGPQRYIQTKITSNPKIGIMPENTAIVKNAREEEFDSNSGFADGREVLGTAEADALTKPPRMFSRYIIVGLGVVGAIAALAHAINIPL